MHLEKVVLAQESLLLQNDSLDARTFAAGPVKFCDSTTNGVEEAERDGSEVESEGEGEGILRLSELRLIKLGYGVF